MTTLIIEIFMLIIAVIFLCLAWFSDPQDKIKEKEKLKEKEIAEIEREIENFKLKYKTLYGGLHKR